MVRAQIKDGATHIKIYPTGGSSFTSEGELKVQATLTLDEMQAIVDEAHSNHLNVMAHDYGGQGLTDSITAGVDGTFYPDGSQGREFEALVRYGMTPVQAIQAATSLGAENIGWEDRVGVIEKGKSPTSWPCPAIRCATSANFNGSSS